MKLDFWRLPLNDVISRPRLKHYCCAWRLTKPSWDCKRPNLLVIKSGPPRNLSERLPKGPDKSRPSI